MHRLNGKVSGSLRVGRASIRFQDVDLHAYIVGSDGRAYTAISGVPQPAARALLPLLPVGGLFAWLFALEEPGSENGFSIVGERGFGMWCGSLGCGSCGVAPWDGGGSAVSPVLLCGFSNISMWFLQSLSQLVLISSCDCPFHGHALGLSLQMVPIPFSCPGAEFTQNLEVTFYPGGETVQVTQTAEGLGPDNYLSLRTHIQGEVPFLPENVTVRITPYKELYSYSSSGKTHPHFLPHHP